VLGTRTFIVKSELSFVAAMQSVPLDLMVLDRQGSHGRIAGGPFAEGTTFYRVMRLESWRAEAEGRPERRRPSRSARKVGKLLAPSKAKILRTGPTADGHCRAHLWGIGASPVYEA
jgi:hypothetical protein